MALLVPHDFIIVLLFNKILNFKNVRNFQFGLKQLVKKEKEIIFVNKQMP